MTTVPSTTSPPRKAFPAEEVEQALRGALTGLCDDTSAIREPWEPLLDSLAVVGILVAVKGVLPELQIAPERIVRKGGYATVDEATPDIVDRLQRDWESGAD